MLTKTWNFNHAHTNLRAWAAGGLNRFEAESHELELLTIDIQVPRISMRCRTRLRRLFVGQRRGRITKEVGIDIGDALAYDFADTIAVTPPLFRIIIQVGDCYDSYRHVPADCLLIEKARSPRVGALRQNVDTSHGRFVLAKPLGARLPSCRLSPDHSRATGPSELLRAEFQPF